MVKVIYLMGIDGAGKTSVANRLSEAYAKQGFRARLLWLRFNHLFSKPLLVFCRAFGFTRYVRQEGETVGYHEFYRSQVLSWLFAYLQYADAWRVRKSKIDRYLKKKNSVLILDRYVYDIMVDIIVDTGISGLHRGRLGRAFRRLLPEGAVVLALKRSKEEILKSRPECRLDRNFDSRYRIYDELIRDVNAIEISNHGEFEDTFRKVRDIVGLAK